MFKVGEEREVQAIHLFPLLILCQTCSCFSFWLCWSQKSQEGLFCICCSTELALPLSAASMHRHCHILPCPARDYGHLCFAYLGDHMPFLFKLLQILGFAAFSNKVNMATENSLMLIEMIPYRLVIPVFKTTFSFLLPPLSL